MHTTLTNIGTRTNSDTSICTWEGQLSQLPAQALMVTLCRAEEGQGGEHAMGGERAVGGSSSSGGKGVGAPKGLELVHDWCWLSKWMVWGFVTPHGTHPLYDTCECSHNELFVEFRSTKWGPGVGLSGRSPNTLTT